VDPYERVDLARRPDMVGVISDFLRELNSICDPLAMDVAAKSDQKALIEQHGGAERILARGGSSYTPIPGEEIKLIRRH
jgi:choline-sulfatase